MRIPSAKVDQTIYFVGVNSTDLKTRLTGLGTFTVQRSRNGAAMATYTTPTVGEVNSTSMPGVYTLLIDEDTTLAAGSDSEEYCVHITQATMAPVTRTVEIYRRDTTSGNTLSITEGDFSDILSRLVVTNSQLLIVKSDTSDVISSLVKVYSDTTHVESQVVRIHSDTITLASDLAEGDFSDILSRLVVTNSQLLIVKSDTSDIRSFLAVIDAKVSDIQSDTNVMVPIISDIQSDTNLLVTKMRGVVLAQGTIGATGNTTTVIHIPDTVLDSLSNDEIKYYNVVIYDNSLDEYHARTITAWTDVGDLATVSPALPFTPEASVDLYWVFPPWSNQFDYDNSDLMSMLTLVRSDTTHIESDAAAIELIVSDIQSDTNVMVPIISDIQSDTNKLVSDATEVDTSDILSLLTLVRSDTTHIESDAAAIELIVSDIQSDTNVMVPVVSDIRSQTVRIHSDTITLASDLAEGDFSDILSRLVVTNSQLLIVKSDTSDIRSQLVIIASDTLHIESDAAHIESQTTQIRSDTITLASDLAEGDFSDILSSLVKIYSDTTVIEGSGTGLSAAQDSKLTEINVQVADAAGEPAQGAPPASTNRMVKLDYLYKAWRNKTEQTATQYSLYDDAGTTLDHKATVADDATTFTRGEVGTGP